MSALPQAPAKWCIEEFTVTEERAHLEAMRAAISFASRGRSTPAGTYERLLRNGQVIMSNTPDELRDLWRFRGRATGRVLINGLGLGIAASLALAKPEVTAVLVIEIDGELIDLVSPRLTDDRVTILQYDALTWRPPVGALWDVVWHDIWDDICADNLADMKRLHRKYGRRCGWQGSWCRYECERAARP